MKREFRRGVGPVSLGWIFGWLSLAPGAVFAADDEKIPPLRPARAELVPSFWEQHGWVVALGGLVFVVALVILIIWLRRPKPEQVTPPQLIARRALEALRGNAEDAALVTEVSRILRQYLHFALQLPPDELTTAEWRRVLQTHPQADPDLAKTAADFLRRCDERKFAPAQESAVLGAVPAACGLIDQFETHRQRMSEAAGLGTPPRIRARPQHNPA
jgi:Domain of unknown function (DUF4381)